MPPTSVRTRLFSDRIDLYKRHPPHVPSDPLWKSTYAALPRFPALEKIATQNLVEGMAGFIGECNLSPSIAKAHRQIINKSAA